jgi:hypothetical protein
MRPSSNACSFATEPLLAKYCWTANKDDAMEQGGFRRGGRPFHQQRGAPVNETECAEQRIITERRGPIFIVKINRPAAKNAFDNESGVAMEAAMDELDQDSSLFVGVITGLGGTFSAGADLKAVRSGESRGGVLWMPEILSEAAPAAPLAR